ncbi:MAG: glycosyltransferase family 2 protein [Leptolyngbyaceae cyanobacterium SM1_3_5]|nr:glycosyltransferase family 2 protein [Leptolyngbyaceae cyanobacterium SM1_3_5]
MESLSACLIVQNAEKLLPIALESLGEIYDELIIVDGGSIDSTCDIAQQFGATLIHSPWPEHHAQQRNVYLDAVKTDWLFAIDSDEFIDLNTLHFLQQLKLQGEQLISELFFLPRCWISPHKLNQYISSSPHYPDGQARIFRPAGLRYQGRVHSIPVGISKPRQMLDHLGLYHFDLFVNSIEQRQAKVAKYAAENPQDGAAEFYIPDQNSLKLSDWSIDSVLPAVADRLRQLDPNLPTVELPFRVFNAQARSSKTAYIIFPNWQHLTAAAFAEIAAILEMIALETEPIDLYVVGEAGDRFVTSTLSNLLSELRLVHDAVMPRSSQIILISPQMQAEILALQPNRLVLGYEDAEAAAFAEDRLICWAID